MHVHTAGTGAGGSGCFVSDELREGYKFGWYLDAFGVTAEALAEQGDAIVIERISNLIRQSNRVDQAVVLAMDGVVDDSGKLDRARTQVYVPNDFIRAETARFDNLLFGASVNPYRHDAIERLHHAKRAGAVLIKWIPAIMDIDPADPELIPYYRALTTLGLPLLIHVGQERSFGPAQDEYGDPLKMILALENGVTVIAAHIATTGENQGEPNYERILPLFDKYENLYADISSLTQVNKLEYLIDALGRPGVKERMIYGSDWPLQFFPLVSPWYQIHHIGIGGVRRVRKFKNQWDRDIALKSEMGVPSDVFKRTAEVLGLERDGPRRD